LRWKKFFIGRKNYFCDRNNFFCSRRNRSGERKNYFWAPIELFGELKNRFWSWFDRSNDRKNYFRSRIDSLRDKTNHFCDWIDLLDDKINYLCQEKIISFHKKLFLGEIDYFFPQKNYFCKITSSDEVSNSLFKNALNSSIKKIFHPDLALLKIDAIFRYFHGFQRNKPSQGEHGINHYPD
jgi:hypothetical protein